MKKILFILILALSSFAQADAPIQMFEITLSGTKTYHSTGQGACDRAKAFWPDATYLPPPAFAGHGCYTPNGQAIRVGIALVNRCADTSAPNTSLPLAQQCTPPPPVCTAGKTYTTTLYAGSATPIVPTSSGGCTITIKEVIRCFSNPTSADPTKKFCELVVTETGAPSGAGSGEASGLPPAIDAKPVDVPKLNPAQGQGCPAGTVSLGVDSTGGSICGGSGTSPVTPSKTEVKQPTSTTSNPDGSVTKVDAVTRTNSDGSTTTTTTTTITGADGKVTKNEKAVTTANPATSGGGKDDSSDDKKDDFCLKNPSLNICKNSEVNAGGCSSGSDSTSCTGDAIQCAILRQQKKEYCENIKESAINTLGGHLLSGTDPMKTQIENALKGTDVDLSSQTLDQSGFVGGGSCFSARSFGVNGSAIPVNFTSVCNNIVPLRAAVLFCSLLVAYLLVSKSVLQG